MSQDVQELDKVKFFKDCLPQILLGPSLNTLTQMRMQCNFYAI